MSSALSATNPLTLLGTTDQFLLNNTSPLSYPDTTNAGPYTTLGPVFLPQIYGKDLNQIEVGSSGIIALSIYDQNVLTVDSNLANVGGLSFNAISLKAKDVNDAINLQSGNKRVVIDSMMVSENVTQTTLTTDQSAGFLVDNALNVSGILSVQSSVTMYDTLSVASDVVMGASLSVSGTATFEDNMFIEGKTLKIPTGTEAERPITTVNHGSIYYNSEYNRFEGLHNDDVWRPFGGVVDTDMDTKIVAELTPGGDNDELHFYANDASVARMVMSETQLSVSLEVIIESNLSIGGYLAIGNVMTISDSIQLQGPLELESTLSVFGATNLGNSLSVAAATTLSSTLSVNAASHFESTVGIKGEATLHNTLSVQGLVTIDDDLSISGNAVIGTTLSVSGQVDMSNSLNIGSTLSVTGASFLEGASKLGNTLSVESDTTLKGSLSVGGAVFMSSSLSIESDLVNKGHLSVGETGVIAKTLSVGQAADFNTSVQIGTTLSVASDTTIGGALSVANDVTLASGSTMFTNNIQTIGADKDMVINLGTGQDGTLTINGSLDVLGTFNNVGVEVTNLQVEDKTITLSTGNTDIPGGQQYVNEDSVLNHKSGLKIEGLPEHFNSNDPTYAYNFTATAGGETNIWEKSFLWNWNEEGLNTGGIQQGPLSSLTSVKSAYGYADADVTNSKNIEHESFWELKGGALRLSSFVQNSVGQLEKISYTMRITKTKELQFIKHEYTTTDGSVYVKKTPNAVATFGVSF
jgi:acyl-[acyl carrier protein]--UDP-N-acetylglucosamine O-acyltransferase